MFLDDNPYEVIPEADISSAGIGGSLSSAGNIASMASGNPLFAIGGQILGGILGKGGDSSAKQFSRQMRMLNVQQKWAEDMSNTAHQREVYDLWKAGLNPILSLTKGPATMPTSASPSAGTDPNASRASSAQATAAQTASAVAIQRALAEIELMRAQSQKTADESALLRESRGKPTEEINTLSSQQRVNDALTGLHQASAGNQQAQKAVNEFVAELHDVNLEFFREKDLEKLQTEINILQEEFKTARRIGKMNDTQFAEVVGYIKMLSDAVPGIKINNFSRPSKR